MELLELDPKFRVLEGNVCVVVGISGLVHICLPLVGECNVILPRWWTTCPAIRNEVTTSSIGRFAKDIKAMQYWSWVICYPENDKVHPSQSMS